MFAQMARLESIFGEELSKCSPVIRSNFWKAQGLVFATFMLSLYKHQSQLNSAHITVSKTPFQ